MKRTSRQKRTNSSRKPLLKGDAERGDLRLYPYVSLGELTEQARLQLREGVFGHLIAKYQLCIAIFFSFTSGEERATTVHFQGDNISQLWNQFHQWQLQTNMAETKCRWLRIDWINQRHAITLKQCINLIEKSKRNYFRYGISFDSDFELAFLEQELNANAVLNIGSDVSNSGLNTRNLMKYGKMRFGKKWKMPTDDSKEIILFTTSGVLVQPGHYPIILHGYCGGKEGRDTGRRIISRLNDGLIIDLISQSSEYLARQVTSSGRFIYGVYPSFNREINTYNALRHASTMYAMLEAVELTNSQSLWSAIERAIEYLTSHLIRQYKLASGKIVSYLCDENNEIKLGGNAVCILALVKYTETTGSDRFFNLMTELAEGICNMQNQVTGKFIHILDATDLCVIDEFRTIYYDGEAAFGLLRLYGLTNDEKWLLAVVKAFDYFIINEHWKSHDHWLSYCVNELTRYRPERKYFEFGIKNFADHLDFVANRITTYPTLLELMMAAQRMICRLRQNPDNCDLLDTIDQRKFGTALQSRAKYLLNGFFWPETAMFFRSPKRILGSFFIRHHSFRVRIDDVEHYLSGYIAYLHHFFPTSRKDMLVQQMKDIEPVRKSLPALFLNLDLAEQLTGIEHASITRALLFEHELKIDPVLVTYKYQPFLQYNARKHINSKSLHTSTEVVGLYDYIQGFTEISGSDNRPSIIPTSHDPEFCDLTREVVPGYKDIRYRDGSGRLFAYKVYSKVNGLLTHINYFHNGRKIGADIFHCTGLRSSHRIYNIKTGKTQSEIYYTPSAIPVFFRIFEDAELAGSDPKHNKSGFYFVKTTSLGLSESPVGRVEESIKPQGLEVGACILDQLLLYSDFIGDEGDFIAHALYRLTKSLNSPEVLIICDKNKCFLTPAIRVRARIEHDIPGAKLPIISLIHSTHFKGLVPSSAIKSHYFDLLTSECSADQIITLTDSQAADLTARFPAKRFSVIPHTYILNSFELTDEPPRNEDHHPFRIAYVARLSPEKNHLMAIDIFAKLLQIVPGATLHLYGEGMEKSKIVNWISDLGLESNVLLEGYRSNIREIYTTSSCSILTSKMEGFSLSLLEAMAFGCPVVAFDIKYGPREIVSHGETGFLVPYGDLDTFASYLVQIATNTELANRLGKQSRERFMDNFESSKIAALWDDVIAKAFLR